MSTSRAFTVGEYDVRNIFKRLGVSSHVIDCELKEPRAILVRNVANKLWMCTTLGHVAGQALDAGAAVSLVSTSAMTLCPFGDHLFWRSSATEAAARLPREVNAGVSKVPVAPLF